MTTITAREARRCYDAHHPVHAAYYFAAEHDEEFGRLGLDGGPMAYLAGRAAPLGAVGPGVVAATFFNFHPRLVARYIPRVWEVASPELVLRSRLRITDRYLTRLLGPEALSSPDMAEAAELALRASEACTRPGRPLYAANADLPVPQPPHLALWHATTLLREHRGDGHIATLVTAGLDALEALVTHTATGKNWRPAFIQATRGWTAQEWAAAHQRLCERGLLTVEGGLTDEGAELRRAIEADTDRLDLAPYQHLGAAGTRRLTELAGAFTKVVLAGGGIPLQDIGRS